MSPREGWLVSQRLRLHYVEWGDPAAPPLLLIHGGRDHARSWDAVAGALADRWRVIAPDLRGHGDSEWAQGGYAMADFLVDLAALADCVSAGASPPAPLPIVAHSLGGNIALRYAALYPDRVSRLVAIEGLSPPPSLEAKAEAHGPLATLRDWIDRVRAIAAREQRSYPDVITAAAQMLRMNPRLSADLARHLTVEGARIGADGRLRFKFDPTIAALSPVDLTRAEKDDLWRRIACPVLLAYGRESWASNPAEDGRAALFRNAEVALFDDAGHWLHHDRFAAFLAAIERFLA